MKIQKDNKKPEGILRRMCWCTLYVRTILNGVGQLSSAWVGTICEREMEMLSIRVKGM